MRPAEVERVVADNAKARSKLGWKPRTSFEQLVHMMVDHDLQLLKTQASAR
jgi:GDPmannose 4,6-dehydratase